MAEPRELNDWEFLQEFLRFFGPGRGLALFGWCIWWAINGKTRFSQLEQFIPEQREKGGLSRSRTYAAVGDLARFRYHLATLEGRELEPEDLAIRILKASDNLRQSDMTIAENAMDPLVE
jgi:hypothetical protein